MKVASAFSPSRGLAIFLAIGGVIWTIVFLIFGRELYQMWQILIGSVVVAFWIARSFNFGFRLLWISGWSVSIAWHLICLLGALTAMWFALVFGGPMAALTLTAIPALWISFALILSTIALISEIRYGRIQTEQDAAANP